MRTNIIIDDKLMKEAMTLSQLKTKKAVAKRFKVSKTGKIKRQKAFRGHLLASKSRKRKRHLRKQGLVAKADRKTVRILLPY